MTKPPYQPDALPLADLDLSRLMPLAGPANRAVARYDGLLHGIVNPAVMLAPLSRREAVLSSRIEGTQATVDEVLQFEAGMALSEDKQKDAQEIINYRQTLNQAAETIKDRPISPQLLLDMHRLLMDSVRGQDKNPGAFRKTQNWIGRPNTTRDQASFVPPAPLAVPDLLLDWAAYLAGPEVDTLIQCAVMHAQFELIHPFRDGNGRIGRLLIPLFLCQKGVLASPSFYLSGYLEAHRSTYYQRLAGISANGEWNAWIDFFLQAITHQAESHASRVQAIQNLYHEMKTVVLEVTGSQQAMIMLDALFDKPVFASSDFVERTGIARPTAFNALKKLREADVLRTVQESAGSQPAVLTFSRLVMLAEGRDPG